VSAIARSRVANRQTVVTAGGQLEFKPDAKVGVLFIRVESAAAPFFADDCTVDDFITIDRACPTGQIVAAENAFETVGNVLSQNAVGFGGLDFTDKKIAPADFAAVGLQLNGPSLQQRLLALPKILHPRMVDDELIVQVDRRPLANLQNAKMIPLAKWF